MRYRQSDTDAAMTQRNTADHWGLPSKLFHWVMAVLVIGLLGMGVYISEIVDDIYRAFDLTQIHKSFGFVAFCLIALRLAWRLYAGAPTLPPDVPKWQVRSSQASHFLLYALMIVMPVSGWLYASAAVNQDLYQIPNEVFGLFALPDPFVPGSSALEKRFYTVHNVGGKLLFALVLIHIAAALKHHFVDRDHILRRMWF